MKTNKPAYLALYESLREEILSGVRPEGSRLPSRRSLARDRGISAITVDHGIELLCEEGYAGYENSYDECGNLIRRSYFGIDGKPVQHVDGNAGFACVYDERGNMIRQSFFGTDGEAVMPIYGYAAAEFQYDEKGTCVSSTYYDVDGNVIPYAFTA